LQKLNKEVVIGGVSYKTSPNKLTKAGTSSIKQQSGRAMKSLPTRTIGEPLVKVNAQELKLHSNQDHYASENQTVQNKIKDFNFCFFFYTRWL